MNSEARIGSGVGAMKRHKIIYFITEDWYFCSHRLPLAVAAQEAGYDVAVVTHVNDHGEVISKAGIRLIPFNISRKSMNILSELAIIARLIALYRKERPDIVHHVAMKPVLYGAIAARLSGVKYIVNAIAGLGYIFSSEKPMARVLRHITGSAFKLLINGRNSRTILQNQDDCALFIRKKFVNKERIRLIRGSGVDTRVFFPEPEPIGVPVVLLAARMLWDKGIKEFVEAARILKTHSVKARFVLVGDTDSHNCSAIPREKLIAWNEEGVIEWWGHRIDMPAVIINSNIVCLPSSYGEGVPKVLIEAAACGRPIVATNISGCREIVKNEKNGFLIPVHSIVDLAAAIKRLIENQEIRKIMGDQGREIAKDYFSIEKVIEETMMVYGELLAPIK